jgi:hypothetical protein
MGKRSGRDWSDWKEHITGMHRLGSDNFKQPHLGTRGYEHTQTSITMHHRFDERKETDPNIKLWVIVFLCALLARKCYFEFTKYERIKATAAPISRVK